MSVALREFLRASYDKPFVWGERDCALWLADWVMVRRGIDLGAGFRGTYSSEHGCNMLLAREGGLLKLAARLFAAAGIAAVDVADATAGDAGCVDAPFGPTLGIVTGRRVALLGRDGLVVSAAYRTLAAWKI